MSVTVVFEGVAGVGKSTACSAVCAALGANAVLIDEFPAEFLNGYMRWQSIHAPDFSYSDSFGTPLTQTFMMAANASYKMECGALKRNDNSGVVIYDRYVESVLAYQGVALKSSGYEDSIINALNESIRQVFLKPDLTCYISLPMDKIRERLERRGLTLGEDYYSFLGLVAQEYERNLSGNSSVLMIDESLSQIDVTEQVLHKIKGMSL